MTEEHRRAVSRLLNRIGHGGAFEVTSLKGGANNRLYLVQKNGERLCLKVYFRHRDDPWDRLATEYSFIEFAWKCGLHTVPRPYAYDPDHALALYEFVEGRRLMAGELSWSMVQQSLDFYRELNHFRGCSEAHVLSTGAEACFSLRAHLDCVEARVQRVAGIRPVSAIDQDAISFVRGTLVPAWKEVKERVMRQALRLGLPVGEMLAPSDRRLSPSDFGFHNALATEEGRVKFIDFEYAGWDDPAKMVCDFFCQPTVPVPLEHLGKFIHAAAAGMNAPDIFRRRVQILFPVYRVKWCCIFLNDFLPVDAERRSFAAAVRVGSKKEQIRKAKQILEMVNEGDSRDSIQNG